MNQIGRFTYAILAGRNFQFKNESILRNSAFESWFCTWEKIYAESNSGYRLSSDEFIRQDLVCLVLDRQEIAALHLYSFFDLESKADLSSKYFHFFSESYLNQLKTLGVRTVMSMEFLTVIPKYRKSIIGFSMGSLISELGTRIFGLTQADAIVAPARNDVKVNEMAYDIGFRCIEKNTQQRGFECDLIACIQGEQRRSSMPNISEYADQLWLRKNILPSAQKFLMQPKENSFETGIMKKSG